METSRAKHGHSMVVCTAHMTPPAQPKKCAASSNGALVFPLRSAESQQPNRKTRYASIQDVERHVRWDVELSDGA